MQSAGHGPSTDHPDENTRLERIELSIRYLVHALTADAPMDWQRIDLRANLTVSVSDVRIMVFVAGREGHPMALPEHAVGALREHRHLSWTFERGAWLSARISLAPPNQQLVSFNWDHLPDWNPPVPLDIYSEDLAVYPRRVPLPWLPAQSEA
ncbi:hypothetical protein [Nocardia cyriacigeorgica]|uniref:hypothetical protein n=1 Tax=Nocardia cyriacigeorgica TaxID=135487 RepID=UPI002454F69C|nr:hypothetical protein [Nocardia cyriacigeorgica]